MLPLRLSHLLHATLQAIRSASMPNDLLRRTHLGAVASQEPELLQAEADRVRRLKQDVAVSQYRAFLAAAQCTAVVRAEVATVRDALGGLVEARFPHLRVVL